MIDINLFRSDKGGNPEIVKEIQVKRFKPVEAVDELVALDKEWVKCMCDEFYFTCPCFNNIIIQFRPF